MNVEQRQALITVVVMGNIAVPVASVGDSRGAEFHFGAIFRRAIEWHDPTYC